MTSTQRAEPWLSPGGTAAEPEPIGPEPTVATPARAHEATVEMDRLLGQVERVVASAADGTRDARATVDSALDAVSRMQVVTANLDASKPINDPRISRALVAFADRHLTGHADAIERGMTYTSDNTMRLLRCE